ncbi:MAG: D-Ala-D-Ala carboxypeptidase family metallohydrolase [Thermovirgaceae bacterium]|nr:D-Ala-D-Ala carboxypeptidase family metallohydrolase [Thermovirgaceae bacterium]
MKVNDIFVSPHFRLNEFQCRCCGCVKLHPELLVKLESLRESWGSPLLLTSGFRCSQHNRKVDGAEASLHLLGQAADIVVLNGNQPEFIEAAEKEGFDQVIPYEKRNFVHLGIFGGDERVSLPVNQHKWEMADTVNAGAGV